jgi:hypothetical protein
VGPTAATPWTSGCEAAVHDQRHRRQAFGAVCPSG